MNNHSFTSYAACKRAQHFLTLLGEVAPADVGWYWQLCANECNNSQWCKNGQCILGRIGAIRVCKLINSAVMLMRCCVHGDHMWCACVAPTMIAELKQSCANGSNIFENKFWELLLAQKFDQCQTSRNNAQQHAKKCKRVCRRTQHVTEDLRQQWPEPGCWPAVFVKTMVCWGCSVSRAQKTWLWSLLFKVFHLVTPNNVASVCMEPYGI